MNILILFIIVYLHIYDDFHMQGILANMKQKNWWEQQYSPILLKKEKQRELYGKDYLCALVIHAFSWAFITHIPYMIMCIVNPALVPLYVLTLVVNMVIHAVVDDLKANKEKINLWTDQSIHICQIIITWLIWLVA